MALKFQKNKEPVSAIMRKYGLDEGTIKRGKKGLRYKNPIAKGAYWYWFSKFVRIRDYVNWGTCISCGAQKNWVDMDAGHYAPAGDCGTSLLFDERNVNGECARCNAWDEGHLIGYRRGLDERYGAGTAQSLDDRYFARHRAFLPDFTQQEYEDMLMRKRAIVESLSTFLKVNDLDAARAVLKSMVY